MDSIRRELVENSFLMLNVFKLFKEANDCIQTSPYFGGFGKASILPEPNKIRSI